MANARKIMASMPLIALAGACVTVGALALTVFRPDAVLDRGVEAALARSDHAPAGPILAPRRESLADSPHFWLSRLDDEPPLGLSEPVQVGDRIDISGRRGRLTLEVVGIREIGSSLTRIESEPGPHLLLVTSRETGTGNPRLVRFIIETDKSPPVGVGESQRTL